MNPQVLKIIGVICWLTGFFLNSIQRMDNLAVNLAFGGIIFFFFGLYWESKYN